MFNDFQFAKVYRMDQQSFERLLFLFIISCFKRTVWQEELPENLLNPMQDFEFCYV